MLRCNTQSWTEFTLQGNLQEVVCVFVHEGFGLGKRCQWPAVVQVALLHGGVEVVVDEVSRRGHAQVPAESLQQQQFHFDEVALIQGQVEAAHEAQSV